MVVSEESLLEKLQHMHYNLVRRGYMDDPVHWAVFERRGSCGEARTY
ncbi:MAG: hypothetical protein AB1512_20090 [Thermodesulfobacteriota bacterium]